MRSLLVFLHLAGVIVWVGGMFFAHYCLRPVAVQQLPPPQRLPLMSAILGRFFVAVTVAIVFILMSGFALLGKIGAATPVHWHLMMGVGLVMVAIFAFITLRLHPQLRLAVAEQQWPVGAKALDGIRRLVVVNLALGILTTAVALLGPMFV